MPYVLGLIAALTLVWWILSGHTEPLILGFGAFSIAFAVFLGLRMKVVDREGAPYLMLGRHVPYWGWLGGEIAKANVAVVKMALNPDLDITPRLVRTKLSPKSDLGKAVFANSITLTPGTVSVELEDDEVLVHALTSDFVDQDGFQDMARRAAAVSDPKGAR